MAYIGTINQIHRTLPRGLLRAMTIISMMDKDGVPSSRLPEIMATYTCAAQGGNVWGLLHIWIMACIIIYNT